MTDQLNERANYQSVGIYGAGIMGEALIQGLITFGIAPSAITISDKRAEREVELQNKYSIKIGSPVDSDVILLVVKPQDLASLLEEVGKKIPASSLVISFVAGRKLSFIEDRLEKNTSVIRVMPNTPILIGAGMSVISAGSALGEGGLAWCVDFLTASGKTIVVEESLQDAVTATSGSGPAYFFRFVEAMISGAIDLGLTETDARTLVIQTIKGAAAMLDQEGAHPSTLRENVTSPHGTTFAALQAFEDGDLGGLVKRAMRAARDRSQELS
jgi:pyrroline-5-carboxylate reductase